MGPSGLVPRAVTATVADVASAAPVHYVRGAKPLGGAEHRATGPGRSIAHFALDRVAAASLLAKTAAWTGQRVGAAIAQANAPLMRSAARARVSLCRPPPKKLFLAWIVIGIALSVSACSPPKPLDFSLDSVPLSEAKIPYRLSSIAVNVEGADHVTNGQYGSRPLGLEKFVVPLRNAIQDAVNKAAIFNYGSRHFCSIDARILGIKYELAGIDFPTTLFVRYTIVDLDNGRFVYDKVIRGDASTAAGYSFVGAVRSEHSIVGSGRANVGNFVSDLEQFANEYYRAPVVSQPRGPLRTSQNVTASAR